MRQWTGIVWSGLLLFASAQSIAADAIKGPPPAAYGTLPRISDARLSFDGNSVAWLDMGSAPGQIIAFDLINKKDRRAFALPPNFKLRGLEWADNDTLIYYASTTLQMSGDSRIKFEMFRMFSADLNTGKTQMFLSDRPDFEYVTGSKLLAAHTSKPKTAMVFTIHYNNTAGNNSTTGTHVGQTLTRSHWLASIYEIDTRTGHSQLLDEGTAFTSQWVVDPDGNSVARADWDLSEHRFSILAKHGLGWTRIYHREDGNTMSLDGLTADKTAIISVGLDKDGRSKLLAIPLDGADPKVLYEDPDAGVASVAVDPVDGHPIAVTLDGIDNTLRYIDPILSKRHDMLRGSFPGMTVEFAGHSPDNNRMLVETSAPDKPPIFYVIDFTTHKADILGGAYPDLAGVAQGKVSTISYKARDGMEIPAYLTLPPGITTAESLPLIVMPHGGPEARDYFTFNFLVQFLASRGYAVLQPQFRGSIGFGEDFRKAGIHEWGGVMQNDVTDGVKAMIEQHIADPRRVCIVGWSYGGYAALSGAAFTPDLYRCAVSINGLFDLPMVQANIERNTLPVSATYAYWREHLGSSQDPVLAERSPNRHVAGIRASVLLIQAGDDTVIPTDQIELMSNALKAGNKSFKLVKIPGDDHWLSTSQARVRALTEIDAFLQANLPN
jgi:dipeptidyl aminopeptidase/acylaminoacyl peptidase